MTTIMHPVFPEARDAVGALVREHLGNTDEPTLLAVYYAPQRNADDIFLLEVFQGFGRDSIDEGRKFFEVEYANRQNFPLAEGQVLHMIMTNPPEFDRAVLENWEHIEELRDAVRRGKFEVVHAGPAFADFRSRLGV